MRFLAIDHGTKRWGLASGDELGLATPLPALTQADPHERWRQLVALIRQKQVDELVIGHPLNMDDSVGPKAREAEHFARQLSTELGLPVHLVDERLTSEAAEATLPKQSRRAVRSSGVIDSRAAALILQDYLNQRFPPPLPGEEEV